VLSTPAHREKPGLDKRRQGNAKICDAQLAIP
jgi:hypothetical protein